MNYPGIGTPTLKYGEDMIDHEELGAFMKACRARVDAEAMGFPVGKRRRVAGLRREEVAELAGISPDWYTRLEQGRDVGVSRRVLECLSKALQLSEAEMGHLFALAGVQRPVETAVSSSEAVVSQAEVLEALSPNPAHCVSGPWDIEAMNMAAEVAFPELHGKKAGGNVMRMIFRDEGFRERLADWESHAKQCLATFRTLYGRQMRDPRFRQLVNELTLSSEEFAAWWPRQHVGDLSPASKRFIDPVLGELRFTVRFFQPTEDPGRILTVFMGDAYTQQRLGEALADRSIG
ncbi:transcriptional regulator [Halomonas elongata]|nr:transcriptional regulator [Halomonas elongata]